MMYIVMGKYFFMLKLLAKFYSEIEWKVGSSFFCVLARPFFEIKLIDVHFEVWFHVELELFIQILFDK